MARSPSLTVSGPATDFTVRLPTGSSLDVKESGGRVLVTYGFPNQQAFLAPASKLGANPTYQRALAQLPAGSSVPLYISFAPITALVGLADPGPSAQKTMRVLDKLSYLIAGGSGGHDRIVLGLN